MKNDPLLAAGTRATRQTERADARQSPNNAGGFSFTLDALARLRRFLVLGVDGGTYYVGEHDLTLDNAQVLLDLARDHHRELVDEVVAISETGRAPRQRPALFALAVAASHGTSEERRYALDHLSRVARTGTHLAQFGTYVQLFRGWGRQLRRAVDEWYLARPVDDLAYQVIKYRQRDGWRHRDFLRQAHPATLDPARRAVFNWLANANVETSRAPGGAERPVGATRADLPALIAAFERAQAATKIVEWVELAATTRLPWEAFPDAALKRPEVWDALLERGLPQTALMRQLPRLTNMGLLPPTAARTRAVCAQLADPDALRRARVHPLNVLVAQRTYASGGSQRGATTWSPSRPVVDALDAAFYAAFGAVESIGRRVMLALDVSGSMAMGQVAGAPLTPREASAALALVTARIESAYELLGFTGQLVPIGISPRQRLDDAIRAVSNLPFGRTDCALPMLHALETGQEFDAFVIYTDSETWFGNVHPHQALRRYRERTGIAARLVVVGMTATKFTIADPTDPGMLDVVGFDTATPNLISDFARGSV